MTAWAEVSSSGAGASRTSIVSGPPPPPALPPPPPRAMLPPPPPRPAVFPPPPPLHPAPAAAPEREATIAVQGTSSMCGELGDPLATGAPALEPPSPGVVSSDAPGAAAALPAPALCIPAQTGSSAQPADASTVTAAGAPSAVAGGPLVAGVPLAVANPSGRSFEAPLITATRPDTGSQMMVESVYTGQSAEAPSAPSAPSALPGVGAAPASTAPTAPIAVGDGTRDADATVVPSATAEPTLVEAGLNTQRAALRRVFEPASYLPVMFQQEGKLTSDAHAGVGAGPRAVD